MPSTTGKELQELGRDLFENQMGLVCCSDLSHAQLKSVDPAGSHGDSDHLEIDYLIPVGETCLVGEITSRNPSSATKKYRTFRRHIDIIRAALERAKGKDESKLWTALGVRADKLREFREVKHVCGFVLFTEVERLQVSLEAVANIFILYREDWNTLRAYCESVGPFSAYPFLDICGLGKSVPRNASQKAYCLKKESLLSVSDRYVTSKDGSGREHRNHVITFLADPYELLPAARVYRRDCLPNLGAAPLDGYQRMLQKAKLQNIRRALLDDPDFIFPNTILIVLSEECGYDADKGGLIIPSFYGAIDIVDGQHRLFAYADCAVRKVMGNNARILVTALHFEGASQPEIDKFSAQTFVEINTNQTKVKPLHLDGISYEILGKTDAKSIAAHILRKVNERDGRVRGLLRTVDYPPGKIQITEVVSSLQGLVNPISIQRLSKSTTEASARRSRGYGNLFEVPIADLQGAEALVRHGTVALERYFNHVAQIYAHDWPSIDPGESNGSALELTKMLAAFVKLFVTFIAEGLDWNDVQRELTAVRSNVMKARNLKIYSSTLLARDAKEIPDADVGIRDDFRFLMENRSHPTSIDSILV